MLKMPEKRIMTEEQLAKLAIARVKALEVRRARKIESDEDKMRILESKMSKLKSLKAVEPVVSEPDTPDKCNDILTPSDAPEPPEPPVVPDTPETLPPKMKKKKTVVIEQSSSESDSENVIFIKRPSRSREMRTDAQREIAPPPLPPPPPERVMPTLNPFHTFSM